MTKIIDISYIEKGGFYVTTRSNLKGLVVIQSSLAKFAKGLEDSIKALFMANEGKRVEVREISNDNDNLGEIRYEVIVKKGEEYFKVQIEHL